MRHILTICVLATLVSSTVTDQISAGVKAKLVESKVIWDRAPNNAYTDLVRFKNRWYCVCWEGAQANSSKGVLRIITSADGAKWESAAVIKCDFPMRGRQDPKLVVNGLHL